MATNWYVRSGAAGANNGTSWANAFTSLTNAMGNNGSGGDTFWVSDDHSESVTNGSLNVHSSNAITAPWKVICVNHLGSVPPSIPTDLRTSAVFATTTTNGINIGDGPAYIYWYGITFNCGSGANNASINVGTGSSNTYQEIESCNLNLTGTGSGGTIQLGNNSSGTPCTCYFRNCNFSFANTGQSFQMEQSPIVIQGGAITAGSATPTTLISEGNKGGEGTIHRFDGIDLSLVTGTLIGGIGTARKYNFINCKLGSGVAISTPGANAAQGEVNILISDSGSKSYRQERYKYQGTLTTETVVVRAGGASDGTTPISWKCVSTANNGYIEPFRCFDIAVWNNLTSGSHTATVQLITDNVVLLDNQCWMDVEYLGSSGFPQATLVSTSSNIGAAGANLTTSSSTWTTTGLGTPKPQQLSVTFSPQMVGLVRTTVYIAIASATVWVDPVVTVV